MSSPLWTHNSGSKTWEEFCEAIDRAGTQLRTLGVLPVGSDSPLRRILNASGDRSIEIELVPDRSQIVVRRTKDNHRRTYQIYSDEGEIVLRERSGEAKTVPEVFQDVLTWFLEPEKGKAARRR